MTRFHPQSLEVTENRTFDWKGHLDIPKKVTSRIARRLFLQNELLSRKGSLPSIVIKSTSITKFLGGGFEYFLFSPRKLGKFPILTNIVQMGWFNHQLSSHFHKFGWGFSQPWPSHDRWFSILTWGTTDAPVSEGSVEVWSKYGAPPRLKPRFEQMTCYQPIIVKIIYVDLAWRVIPVSKELGSPQR